MCDVDDRVTVDCFNPYQWFEDNRPDELFTEVDVMWVYRLSEPGLWTVGFYSPDKQWFSDSDWADREAAAKRCRFLNGGN